jgi:hypothetical protein
MEGNAGGVETGILCWAGVRTARALVRATGTGTEAASHPISAARFLSGGWPLPKRAAFYSARA